VVFVLAEALQTEFSFFSNFRDILVVCQICLCIFCRYRESIRPGTSWKALGNDVGVRCVTTPSYWPFVLCSFPSEISVRVGGINSPPFILGFGLRQGCVLSPLLFIFYMNWIDSNRRFNEGGITVGSCRTNSLLFLRTSWYCTHSLNRVFNMHLINFQLRTTKREWKLEVKGSMYCFLQKPKPVRAASKRQYIIAGGEVQVP